MLSPSNTGSMLMSVAVLVSGLLSALTPETAHAAAATCGIFVSQTQGSDAGDCGLDPASPCATINFGLARAAVEGQTCIFVQAGSYSGSVVVPAMPMSIYGGYDTTWDYAPRTTPGHNAIIQGGFDAGIGQYVAVRVSPGANVLISNLEIRGANASGTTGGVARSAYAVYAQSATLSLDGVLVVAGNGANGTAGASGVNASQVPAPSGGPGGSAAEFVTACDNTSRGTGGPGGTGGPRGGGAGGHGGTMDTDCSFPFDLDARPGFAGNNAATFISNGKGYRGNGGALCLAGGNANAGASSDGAGGTGATQGGLISGSLWLPKDGLPGALGTDGSGGGGGGGSGGCDIGTDSYGAGGGGGGAGGVRAVSAGDAGRGGGGSFCVFSILSTLDVTNTELQRGIAGAGGGGGAGAAGQPGGLAGNGGAAAGDSGPGGKGGAGADGGASGGGGGGAGGMSYGIYMCSTTYTPTAVTVSAGSAGPGGAGGAPAAGGNPGGNGTSGSVISVFSTACVEPQLAARPPAKRARNVSALASQGGPACDIAPCLTVDVPRQGERFTLSFTGALPNPSSGRATFHFTLPEPVNARLRIFDAGGRLVRVVDPGTLAAGRHTIVWDGRNDRGGRAGAGVYFSRFEAMGETFSRRFVLVR